MKFTEELSLPPEIGINVCQFLMPDTLLKASLVCVNWNDFFSNDFTWKQKLKNYGIENKLEELKKHLSVSSYKELYMMVTSKKNFLDSVRKSNTKENFITLEIIPAVFELIRHCMYVPQFMNNESRLNHHLLFMTRSGLTLYHSIPHFLAINLLRQGCAEPTSKLIRFPNLAKEELSALCHGNEQLILSLQNLNQQENPIFSLFQILLSLSGQTLTGNLTSCKITSSLVHTGRDALFYSFNYQNCLTDSDSWEENAEPNLNISLVVEIAPTGWSLLDYSVSVSKNLYPFCASLFKNLNLIGTYLSSIEDNHKINGF